MIVVACVHLKWSWKKLNSIRLYYIIIPQYISYIVYFLSRVHTQFCYSRQFDRNIGIIFFSVSINWFAWFISLLRWIKFTFSNVSLVYYTHTRVFQSLCFQCVTDFVFLQTFLSQKESIFRFPRKIESVPLHIRKKEANDKLEHSLHRSFPFQVIGCCSN